MKCTVIKVPSGLVWLFFLVFLRPRPCPLWPSPGYNLSVYSPCPVTTDFRKDTEPRHSLGGFIFLINSKENCMMESKLIISSWTEWELDVDTSINRTRSVILMKSEISLGLLLGCLRYIAPSLPPQSKWRNVLVFSLENSAWWLKISQVSHMVGLWFSHLFISSEIHLVGTEPSWIN